ncbi:cell division protein FtsZ [Candidatus Woesearchaeota archaeon]|nr:cell division protein FtsZ [Candidatus Woesearchaeota archaeon]
MESLVERVFENTTTQENAESGQKRLTEPASSETQSFEAAPQQAPAKEASPAAEPTLDETIQNQFGLDVKGAKIVIVGAGGAGNNMTARLVQMGINGATTLAVNTDAKHLAVTNADQKLLLGKEVTRGLGAGGYPDVGRKAAQESERDLKKALEGADMVYLLAGLGGGTGTGSLPVISKIAKEMGAISIACVTMPFKIEGARIRKAEDGLYQLRQVCDTAIVLENDKLLKVAGERPLSEAFGVADELIATTVKGVTETISTPSLVNLDYADVKAIMHSGGVAAVGFGESNNRSRAEEAISKALQNPLLEVDYTGGSGALIHITGGDDLKLDETNTVGEYVSKLLDPDAQVIWGARIDPEFTGKLRVITIITGVKSPYILGPVERQEESKTYAQELGIPMVK